MDELRERIIEKIYGTRERSRIPSVELLESDWNAVYELVASKYGNWNWNFGENPPSNVQRSQRFPAGEIDARLDIRDGRIAALRIFGDFMGREDVAELEDRLVGVAYDRPSVSSALGDVDVAAYFGDVARDDVIGVIVP